MQGRLISNPEELDVNRSGSEYFDAQAERWETLYRSKAAFRDRLALFTRELRELVPSGGRVLDVGCGPAVMSLAFSEMGYSVVGVDRAPNMIGCANRARQRHRVENAEFLVMDAMKLAFASESFDAVVCSSLVEYIENDEAFLRGLARLVRPGGALLISVPHKASVLGRMEDASAHITRLQRLQGRGYLTYQRRRYDKDAFVRTLEGLSLGSFRCTYFEVPVLGSLGVPLSRVRRLGLMLLVAARKSDNGVVRQETSAAVHPQRGRHRVMSRKNMWDAMPSVVKRFAGPVVRLLDASYILGWQYRRYARFVERAQWWSRERAREYQLGQMRGMLAWAYEKTPYYRESFEGAGFHPSDFRSLEDVSRLPIIDRDTLRRHLNRMCAQSPDGAGVEYVTTGGTSGAPLGFYIGVDRSATEYAYLVSGWRRAGYRLSALQCVFRGQVVGRDGQGMHHDFDPLLRRHHYSTYHLTDDSIGSYLRHISTLEPCYIQAYPSAVTILARYLDRKGVRAPNNIRGILAGSENVYEDDRATAERAFGVRYLSWYGHSEKLVLAVECEHSTRYHVWPTYGYFELLDEEGRPVTEPGKRGEIVGTGFINRVVPFIRYRTGDFATYVGDRCGACGREHPLIEEIRGHRIQEMLVAHDGALISWTALNMHDDTFDNVLRFQFVQTKPGQATLRIVPAARFNDEDRERVRRNLDRKLKDRIEFDVELCDRVALTFDGKSIYVDQRIKGFEGVTGGDRNA